MPESTGSKNILLIKELNIDTICLLHTLIIVVHQITTYVK